MICNKNLDDIKSDLKQTLSASENNFHKDGKLF